MNKSQIINRDLDDVLFKTNDEITISKSPYSAYEAKETDELVFKGKITYVKTEHIIIQSQMGYLKIKDDDTTDLEILKALDELEFATSRMIAAYLKISGLDIPQKKVHKRLIYLSNLKAVSAYLFKSKDKDGKEKMSDAPIYFLDTASKFILLSQGIPIKDKLEITLKSKNGIKETLSRNQLMLTYIQDIKNIECTKNSPKYRLPNGDLFRPAMLIVFNHKNSREYMYFEFIRSYNGWEDKAISQLDKYKTFVETFKPSKSIPSLPGVVLVAEDDIHALNILKLIIKNDLHPENQPFVFTTDNRVISGSIKENSMFIFGISGNKAQIELITPNVFVI